MKTFISYLSKQRHIDVPAEDAEALSVYWENLRARRDEIDELILGDASIPLVFDPMAVDDE